MKKFVKGVRFAPKNYSDEVEAKIQHYKREGYKLPSRHLLRTEEQLAGIRESARINTALLDYISENIREGMSTAEIDHMVYCFTTDHDAIPAPFLYEGFPKSVCVSINDVVCHGIPSTKEFLRSGDIVNVDVSTIYKGYFSDASRMYMIGEVSPEMQRLVQVTRECRDIGIQAAQPWARLGDVGAAIQEHAEKNGYSVVRDLCGHGVGIKFHEEPDVEHFGKRGTGMLIVPGMTFTIEPMINMGSYEVFIDEADGWTVCTDDGLPSAQWGKHDSYHRRRKRDTDTIDARRQAARCPPRAVHSVPTVGTPCTTLWYCLYQPLVFFIPTIGISRTARWYCPYRLSKLYFLICNYEYHPITRRDYRRSRYRLSDGRQKKPPP